MHLNFRPATEERRLRVPSAVEEFAGGWSRP